jgi:ArsR family transcriptional regulator
MIIEVFGRRFSEILAQQSFCSMAAGPTTSLHSRLTMDRSEVKKISKALADETRLRIFETISATNRMTCGEVVSMRGVTPATVSHHLKILGEAKLITCRREGQFIYNQAVPETIAAYTRALATIAGGMKAKRRK